ncbi:MAG: ubiquinol-cytochrome c reductase iron-sulfur subunit [Nitrospinota bacterium]
MTELAHEVWVPRLRRKRDSFPRRHFLSVAAWGGFFLSLGIGALGALRYLFPRVLFEPSRTFRAGRPEDYIVGEVNERFKLSKRAWIVREEEGFYALLAICTHLGCTPRWLRSEQKFKCPCHGSGFYKSGINFEGPAPRPLERLKIALNEERQIVIEKANLGSNFRQERGQWDDPGAYLHLKA